MVPVDTGLLTVEFESVIFANAGLEVGAAGFSWFGEADCCWIRDLS
jgi:hypothetical protein